MAGLTFATLQKVPKFYSGQTDCPTLEALKDRFSCDHEMACELLDLAESGFHYGCQGYWPDGNFAEDHSWSYGLGEKILMLEFLLGQEDDDVFRVFRDAHAAGLEWFEQNSN